MRSVTHVVASAIALGNQIWRKLTDLNGRERSYVVVTPQWVIDAVKFTRLPDVHLYPPVGLEKKYAEELRRDERRKRERERIGDMFAQQQKRSKDNETNFVARDARKVEVSWAWSGRGSYEQFVFRAKSAPKMMENIERSLGADVRVVGLRGHLERYARTRKDLEVEVVDVDNLEGSNSVEEVVQKWFSHDVTRCTVYIRVGQGERSLPLKTVEDIDELSSDDQHDDHANGDDPAGVIVRELTGDGRPKSCLAVVAFLRGFEQQSLCQAVADALVVLIANRRLDRAELLVKAAKMTLAAADAAKLVSLYEVAFRLANTGIEPRPPG
ncbi:Translation factor guf1 mitochondrial, variant 2 [Perkinsus olseni]|nr:Translation factor guf1 mitochondrial, variant 2 [Perkinsus olseni]